MSIFAAIRLVLWIAALVVLTSAMLRVRQAGYPRQARGLGLMAGGVAAAIVLDLLPLFGMPREHLAHWVLFLVGIAIMLGGALLVVKAAGTHEGGHSNGDHGAA